MFLLFQKQICKFKDLDDQIKLQRQACKKWIDVDQKKSSWWETFGSMLEPGVRYLPHPGPAALNLDAAVDLSKKSSVG